MNMITSKTNRRFALAVAVACSTLAASGCRGALKSKPPIHPVLNMDDEHYLQAQEDSDFFDDGRAMRPSVPGTIPVGGLRDNTAYYEGIESGEYISTLPEGLALSQAFLDRGEERYEIYCTPCHGPAGRGHGIVGKRASQFGALIPTFQDETRRSYPVGRIYNVITHGFNNMASYAAQIPVEDRWAISAYVRVLQINQDASEEQFSARKAAQGNQE